MIPLWHTLFASLLVLAAVITACQAPTPTPTSTPTSTPVSASAEFTVGPLTAAPIGSEETLLGDQVTIWTEVSNVGGESGVYRAVLRVDGEEVDSQEVRLGPGEKGTVSFIYASQSAGMLELDVGGATATLAVFRPAEFVVGPLSVTPTLAGAGETVRVEAQVTNMGDVQGTYTASLSVDGSEVDSQEVVLAAGATETVSLEYVAGLGEHTLELGGQSVALSAVAPARLQVNALSLTPTVVFPGQEAMVEAEVHNIGELKGELQVRLEVDGVETDSRSLLLGPGQSGSVSFTVIRDIPGIYGISVGEEEDRLIVPEAATYDNDEYLYSITYPAEWTLHGSNPRTLAMSWPGVGLIEIDTFVEPALSLEEVFDLWVENMKASLWPDFAPPALEPMMESSEVVGYSFEGEHTDENEVPFKVFGELTRDGRWAWVAYAVVVKAVYEPTSPVIRAALDSFKPRVVAVGSYTDTMEGFRLTLPEGWHGWAALGGIQRFGTVSPPDDALVFADVYMLRLPEVGGLQEQALEWVDVQYGDAPDYQLISQGPVELGPQTSGHEMVFGFTSGGVELRVRHVSVIRSTQYFVVEAVATTEAFEQQAEQIESLLSSFTLQEPEPFGVSRADSLFLAGRQILTLDPALDRGSAAGVTGAIFSGLVALDNDLKVTPDLAERWTVSDDGTVYTFYLRQGAQFHNGKTVTAHDVKFSWERAADPVTASPKARTFLGDIVGLNEKLDGKAEEVSGLEVIDTLTLQVTIDGRKPYFLQKLTYPTAYVVDRANVASGPNWIERPNGTGPFKLKARVRDEILVLERNDLYYRGVPQLAHVVYRLFAGDELVMYKEGEIDVVDLFSSDLEEVLDPAGGLSGELVVAEELCTSYLAFNPTIPPFDDVKVRQAFALALNMAQWIEETLRGAGVRASGMLPPDMPGHNQELDPVPFDPELARQLIAESKYGSVADLPAVVAYSTSDAFIAMWLEYLGVQVENRPIFSAQQFNELRDQREMPLTDSGWCADYPDPQNFLEVLFQTGSFENHFGYSNLQVDEALGHAAVEPDPEARMALYREIEQQVLSDWVAVPLAHSRTYVLVKPHVRGYFVAPMGIHVLKDVSISEE